MDKSLNPLKVLSVDWDYYINATEDERDKLFISPEYEITDKESKDNAWSDEYRCNSDLSDITTDRGNLIALNSFLSRFVVTKNSPTPLQGYPKLYAHENHGELYKILANIIDSSPKINALEVVNIDYHHDLFFTGGDTLNCGNWARLLIENLSIPVKYSWVRRKDSQPDNFYKTRSYLTFSNFMRYNKGFMPDVIFFCRSDTWSPPHLDIELYKLLYPFNEAYKIEGFEYLTPRKDFLPMGLKN